MRVLITGGSSGLGKALASIYARHHEVIIVGRNEEKLKEVCDTLLHSDYLVADLTTPFGLKQVIEYMKHHPIDCLINNAGKGMYGKFDSYNVLFDEEMLRLNIHVPVCLMKAFMQTYKKGIIVNISSIASCQVDPLMAVYGASKSFLSMLTKSLQTEAKYSNQEYQIILCLPGMFQSNFHSNAHLSPLLKGLSAIEVAEKIDKGIQKNKKIIIPGKINKCAYYLSKAIPNCLMGKIEYTIQKSKR